MTSRIALLVDIVYHIRYYDTTAYRVTVIHVYYMSKEKTGNYKKLARSLKYSVIT